MLLLNEFAILIAFESLSEVLPLRDADLLSEIAVLSEVLALTDID